MAVTDETVSRVLNAVPKGLLIGGKWISTESTIGVEDPSTGQSIAQVADATPAQGIEALDAAVAHLSGLGIRSLTSQPPTLEELFLRQYGDQLAPEDSSPDQVGAHR